MNGYQQHHGVTSQPQQKQERHSSPLRFKDPLPMTGSNIRQTVKSKQQLEEEEEYERRRQDEIRKTLLKDKSDAGKSPYRASRPPIYNNTDMQSSSKSYLNIPEREKPSTSHFTLGPSVNESSYEAPPQVKEQIANIQSDNSSLMRRLNLVIQELDRVNREKEDIYQRLNSQSKEKSDIQKLINGEDNVDKVNKYMSDDLIYERDRNHKLKNQIKELDLFRGELVNELRKLQDMQDDIAKDNQQLSSSLKQKLNMIQDIEKEHFLTQDKIKQANQSIESLKLDQRDEYSDKMEMQRILNALSGERNDLLNRLDHLTRKYDECVKDISHDRAEMDQHNKQHAKLITAKIIFQQLELIQRNRISTGFQEFKQYCSFDEKCHSRLNRLAKLLEKIAHYKMQRGLKIWFGNGLQPLKIKKQSMLIAQVGKDSLLKLKMFIAWKSIFNRKIQQYDFKTKAVQKIWQMSQKDTSIELKRAFQIWKETLGNFNLQKQRIKKLIWKIYFNKLSQAMNTWNNHSSNIGTQVRLHLLSKEYAQKQHLTILFHNFKYQVTESKRKRFNILFHCLKSWKDHLSYQKFLMSSNLVAMHFKRSCDTSILKSCFDALKVHKEKEKLQKVSTELNGQEIPLIQAVIKENDDIEVQRKFKDKSKVCESIKKMLSKQLYGYFLIWKQINEEFKEKLRTTIKDKIIRAYMQQMRTSFTYWKTLHDGNKLKSKQNVISDLQQQQNQLSNNVIDIQNNVQQKSEKKDCSQQKQVSKCLTSFQRRQKQLAIGRWRDQITQMNFKQDGASTIIKRMRLRFLRKGFDLYLSGVKYQKKLVVEEQRCALYNKTRNERLKRQVLNAWILFNENHIKAKKYWNRMYLRLDIGMKQTTLKKWKEGVQKCIEKELAEKQHSVVDNIENLNNEIGTLNQNETQQQMNIKVLKDQMSKQAQRIISNAFARFYYVSETRGFEKWKEFVIFEKNKEKIIKKILGHWKKYQFYFVKSCFQNWIINSNIEIKKEQLKKEEMRAKDSAIQLDMQNKAISGNKQKIATELEDVRKSQQLYNNRLQKSVQMIINKVDNNHYTSQKRFILQQWRDHVKREVNFIKCIQNVIQKSLWSKALLQIREFSRESRDNTTKEVVLNRFRIKFWKRTCANAFSQWKSGAKSQISFTIEELNSENAKVVEEFQNKKAKIKEVNMVRSGKIIKKNQLKSLFLSWKNVIKFFKLQNAKDNSFNSQAVIFYKRMALWKWQQRTNATKQARLNTKRLKEKYYRMRLRQYFNAFRNQFYITKQFCQRLSNLASIHDHQGLNLSFNAINSFAKQKKQVHETKKTKASKDICSILGSLFLRKKSSHWKDFRIRTISERKTTMIKSFTLLHCLSNKIRQYFLRWKEEASQRQIVNEMKEEGPIKEEIFGIQSQLKNLKMLMQEEGYGEQDFQNAVSEDRKKQNQLILKSVKRMQHYNDDLYVIPKAFDRWRLYLNIKKLFRYQLDFVSKRGSQSKCDLHQAFDKWKNLHANHIKELQQIPKDQLDKKFLKNCEILEKVADDVQNRENALDSLEKQRDTLVENYVKGQKLALSLWVNYGKKALHQAFLRWCNSIKTLNNDDALNQLRRNLELIENLKKRIKQFEGDNDTLANENEELRQYSLDGYEIAKNVQTLTIERENLSVDLADKAQIIRKLLDDNDKLTSKLKRAQEEASTLIKSTMAGSTGFKNGKVVDRSPLNRSNY